MLILRHRERTVTAGGGANAANNLADLGVNVLLVGVVGDDEAGRSLLRGFRKKRIPVVGVLKDKSYATVTKTRILAGMTHTWRQQVVRVDREPDAEPNGYRDAGTGAAGRAEYSHARMPCCSRRTRGYGAADHRFDDIRQRALFGGVLIVADSWHRLLYIRGNGCDTQRARG